jgi:hypothetical protein
VPPLNKRRGPKLRSSTQRLGKMLNGLKTNLTNEDTGRDGVPIKKGEHLDFHIRLNNPVINVADDADNDIVSPNANDTITNFTHDADNDANDMITNVINNKNDINRNVVFTPHFILIFKFFSSFEMMSFCSSKSSTSVSIDCCFTVFNLNFSSASPSSTLVDKFVIALMVKIVIALSVEFEVASKEKFMFVFAVALMNRFNVALMDEFVVL